MAALSDSELARYARQLILPEVDLEGQARLKESRVLIVGAGGLGTPAAQYLAGAGVGSIRLVDDDRIALSNLPRQLAYTEDDLGQLKVEVLAGRLGDANGEITVDAQCKRFDGDTASQLLDGVDIVLDATDSLQARLDIDRATYAAGLPWVMGAAVGTSGQWAAFDESRREGCYHCLMRELDSSENRGCAELGILGPVVGLVALQQSLLVIRYLVGSGLPTGCLHVLDAWKGEASQLALGVCKDCVLCQEPSP
ncbi:MAG: Molybdopterin-synthase adenylyltransferase [Halieaceae bacterium]|nr:MAG: Molybdopterin-synthase adenylyltransferase [Halieaceae bacterium]